MNVRHSICHFIVPFGPFIQRCHQFLKAVHGRLQILDDIRRQDIGIGQAVQVCKGPVFDPENVQAGFVPLQDFINAEFAPASFGVFFRPGFGALVAVLRVVALNEIRKVSTGHRVLLQREMDIGS